MREAGELIWELKKDYHKLRRAFRTWVAADRSAAQAHELASRLGSWLGRQLAASVARNRQDPPASLLVRSRAGLDAGDPELRRMTERVHRMQIAVRMVRPTDDCRVVEGRLHR